MKKVFPMFAAALMMAAGCSSAAPKIKKSVEPEKWTILEVGEGKDLESGRYELDNESIDTEFAVYVSDTLYKQFSNDLDMELVQTLSPDQDLEVRLKDGNYLYIAATSRKTGVYEEGLKGNLMIEQED
ncbi:MAG: hypothetical protein HUJ55_06935 [Ileibacterium sp.]|nr:hypothetical protein [Ileibacterium sp.]